MIPYSYQMVDMGGIDLAEANGTVVDGLYDRLAIGRNACGDLILYNWKFAGIEIAPSPCSTIDVGTSILINGAIQVTEQDEVSIPGVYPVQTLVELNVEKNGVYLPVDYDADGFNRVSVSVPDKYQEVNADYIGIESCYQALNGGLYGDQSSQQCLYLATLHSNYNYVLFLPENVSTRFRAAKWQGKYFSDFEPYLSQTFSQQTQIFAGGEMITPSTELEGDGLTRRFFFTGVDGEIVVGTSNVGVFVKPILLRIKGE